MRTLLTIFCTVLALTACNESENPAKTAKASNAAQADTAAQPAEQILVGSELGFPPFEFKDEHGKPVGFEVQILEAIAKAEDFQVQFLPYPRNQFADALNDKKFRIMASAIAINTERAAQVDFSKPILDYDRRIILLDTPKNAQLQTVNDFKGKKLSANRSLNTAAEITGSAANVVKTPTFYLSLKMMYNGQTDGVLGDSRVLEYFSKQHPEIKTRTISLGESKREIAFAVRKGDTEMLNKLNRGLDKIKADGTYQQVFDQWFGQN